MPGRTSTATTYLSSISPVEVTSGSTVIADGASDVPAEHHRFRRQVKLVPQHRSDAMWIVLVGVDGVVDDRGLGGDVGKQPRSGSGHADDAAHLATRGQARVKRPERARDRGVAHVPEGGNSRENGQGRAEEIRDRAIAVQQIIASGSRQSRETSHGLGRLDAQPDECLSL